MKILQKKLLVFLLTIGITFTSMGSMVFAYPNSESANAIDTKETAYQLTANTLDNSLTWHYNIISGCYLNDSNDTDWYKVYLNSGIQTLTINSLSNNKIAEVISEDGSVISTSIHGPSTKKQHKFTITNAGTYYIKINSNESFSTKSEYSILVGAPLYLSTSYSKPLNTVMTVTSSKKTSSTVNFDLTTDTSIPEGAIVDKITITGTEVNKYYVNDKVRSIKPSSLYSWFDIPALAVFEKDVLNTSQPIMLKQGWSFKHSVSSFFAPYTSYSLNPIIKFHYQYDANN